MINPFAPLKAQVFPKLYLSQTISLLGDAFTWVGIALLAFQFGGSHSASILATALTLRVVAFIIFGPYAGVIADRIDRKKILYTTHFVRMAIVACLPFVTTALQIYILIFLLNIFNAFFTPAYQAAIPQSIKDEKVYSSGIALSNATEQMLGVLGPGLAGAIAAWLGARQIFFVDAGSFIIAAVIIVTLPALMMQEEGRDSVRPKVWTDVVKGTKMLFENKAVRFALLIELVSAIAGAQILVNTVGFVKGQLHLGDKQYGYVMAAFGIGAAVAAFASGNFDKSKNRVFSLFTGGILVCLSIAFANYVVFVPLLVLWLIAGFGQTLGEMPSLILIAEKFRKEEHGKIYGAHFAWSHLWWAVAYPIAGFTGYHFPNKEFLIGAIVSLTLLIVISLLFYRRNQN
ncbi:MAG: MFS transporter [Ginsengibacter sp.]